MRRAASVLVTGARAPVALDIVRTLGSAGYTVVTADSTSSAISRYSRFSSRFCALPATNRDSKKYESELLKLLCDHDIGYMLPTCEETLWLPQSIPQSVKLIAPSRDVARKLHDKREASIMLASIGIDTPRPIDPREALPADMPIMVKPRFSRSAVGARKVTPQSLGQVDLKGLMVQEYVEGQEYCVTGFAQCGELVASVCYEPSIRAAGARGCVQGPSVGFTAIDKPEGERIAAAIVRHCAYSGFIGIDCIERSSGRTLVLDINPRATSGIHLLIAAGMNGEMMMGETRFTGRVSPGMTVWLPMVGVWCGFSSGQWRKMLKNIFRGRSALDRWHDPLPSLMQVPAFAALLWKAWRNNITMLAASTHDIEWNGEVRD